MQGAQVDLHGVVHIVRIAARHAKAAGCEWLEVDFEEGLEAFYYDACGFTPAPAGLIRLFDLEP